VKWWQSHWRKAGLVGIVLALALPLFGHWLRQGNSSARCALDGRPIDRGQGVRIVEQDGHSARFCCIHCAEAWLARHSDRPKVILVADEARGEEIDARAAFFVRSFVLNRATGSRIHVFRTEEEATRHAAQFHGSLLSGRQIPFTGKLQSHSGTGKS
jgi:hypothetical protein